MRIIGLFFNLEIRTGGHRRYLELLDALADKGHEVVLLKREELDVPYSSFRTLQIEAADFNDKRRAIQFIRYVKKGCKFYKDSLSNANWIVIFGETHFFASLYLRKKFKSKLLFAYRSDLLAETKILFKFRKKNLKAVFKYIKGIMQYSLYEKLISRKADKIIFQSEYDRNNWIHRNNNSNKTEVIGGNIGLPWYKKEYELKNKSSSLNKLLFIGSFNKRKGIEMLIESFSSVAQDCPNLELVIAGFGPDEEKIKKKILENKLSDKITFLGRITNPFPEYISSDLLVVPSLFDSYPNTVLESIHCGCPVIGSSIGGIDDILNDRFFLFNPGDTKALGEKIKNLYSDRNEYMKLKEKTANRLKHFHFDWAGRFENIIKE